MYLEIIYFFVGVLLSVALTGGIRIYALRSGLMDHPNARSSHVLPTPRGGGAAIVAAVVSVMTIWGLRQQEIAVALVVIGAAGMLLAVVGYIDDRYSLAARFRLLMQFFAAAICLFALYREYGLGAMLPWLPFWLSAPLLCVVIVWATNLYNFMDGIDGIAASQAIFVGGAGWVMCTQPGSAAEMLCIAIAGSSLGFLLWNWSPAAIFMGDVGSAFLGFMLVMLAVLAEASGALSIWTSMALSTLFLADATVTLVRRLLSGRRWDEAHRSHAYQILSRRWGSHARVSAVFLITNVLVVLPFAFMIQKNPDTGSWVAIGLLAVSMLAAAGCGAGSSTECSRG